MATMPTSPAGRPLRRCAERGYTLVELLVVLALLALLTVLATPMIGRSMQSELRATADAMVGDLRTARSHAMSRNRDTALRFDTVAGTVANAGQVLSVLPDGATMHLVVADDERETTSAGRIRFHPDGSSTGGRVTLRHSGRAIEIDVDWLDGQVEVRNAQPG